MLPRCLLPSSLFRLLEKSQAVQSRYGIELKGASLRLRDKSVELLMTNLLFTSNLAVQRGFLRAVRELSV